MGEIGKTMDASRQVLQRDPFLRGPDWIWLLTASRRIAKLFSKINYEAIYDIY